MCIECTFSIHTGIGFLGDNDSSLTQEPNELIRDFVVRLKSSAIDCPSCNFDLLTLHVQDQFIRGIHNGVLQTYILAKANHVKTLEGIFSMRKPLKQPIMIKVSYTTLLMFLLLARNTSSQSTGHIYNKQG